MWLLLFYVQLSKWGAAGQGHPQPGVLTAVACFNHILLCTTDTRAPIKQVEVTRLLASCDTSVELEVSRWPLQSFLYIQPPVVLLPRPRSFSDPRRWGDRELPTASQQTLISLFCLQGSRVTVEYITSTSKQRKQTSMRLFFWIKEIFQAHARSP